MTSFRQFSRGTQALIAANVVLAIVVVGELLSPAAPQVTLQDTASQAAETLPDFGNTSMTPPASSQLVDMVDRPLFYEDRRLPEPPPEVAAPSAPLRLSLQGVALAGSARIAVFRNPADKRLIQLSEGMTYEGWTLDAVDSGSVRFSRGGSVTELPLAPAGNTRRR